MVRRLSDLAYDEVKLANVTLALSTSSAAYEQANAAYILANNVAPQIAPSFLQANTARDQANAAFLSSNSVNAYSNSTYVKLTATSQTITGNLSIVGDLSLSGNTIFLDATRLQIDDPLIYLAGNNYTSDIVDIGFIANYVNATGQNVHTGLYREHENKQYYLFQGYDKEPINNHIGAMSNNMTLAVLNADLVTSNLLLGGANAILTIGAAFNKANSSLQSGTDISVTGIVMPSTSTERTVKWNFTGRDVYIFGRDSDDVVGLYDTVGGLRWSSNNTNNLYTPTITTGSFASTGRIYSNEWVQFDNYTGIYSPLNNAHFYPNNGTYGSWYCRGTRNGWAGIEFYDSSTTLMMNTDSYGFHYNGVGWRFYVSGGSLYVPGDITAYWSDRRLKENLKPIGSEASDILSKLTAYRFNWNDRVKNFNIDVEPGKEEIGLIAQEVQAVLPDAVAVNKAGSKLDEKGNKIESDYLTIRWNKITPLLVQALNDTKKKLDDTTRELDELKQLLKDKGII